MNNLNKKCKYCNKIFYYRTHGDKIPKFCSHKCSNLFKKGRPLSEIHKKNLTNGIRKYYQTIPKNGVILNCKYCKKEFYLGLSDYKKNQKYCCRKCKHQDLFIKRKCKYCKKEFKISKNIFEKGYGQFCSVKCHNQSMTKKKITKCIICKKLMTRFEWQRKKNEGKYCSNKCQGVNLKIQRKGINNPSWNNGSSKLPYDFNFNEVLKESVRRRDHHRCQICGKKIISNKKNKKKKLAIHHIDYNKLNSNPQNLISLCNSCHSLTIFNRIHWIQYFASYNHLSPTIPLKIAS